MKTGNGKKYTTWLLVLLCVLFLNGCSADEAGRTANASSEDLQTKEEQSDDTQERTLAEGTSGSDGSTAIQSAGITEQEALGVALSHAGVKESDVTSQRIQRDYEDGKEIYDVEFSVGNKEYDYEIGVEDGSVVKADFEIENDQSTNNVSTKKETSDKDNTGSTNNKTSDKSNSNNSQEITKDEAKKIALAKVPGAKNIQIEKDREDGKVVYEGEIHYNNMEYDFEIDAATGKILSWEEEKED